MGLKRDTTDGSIVFGILVMIGVPIDDKGGGVRMRIFGVISFLLFFVASAPLFAQQSGSTSTAATSLISTEFGGSYEGVQNVSEQAQGTFIGGGRPDAFVGNAEIYNTSSSRSSSTSRRATAARTTTARPVTTTAARRTTAAATRGTQTGSANNQTIRSATSLDSDLSMPTQRIQSTTVASQLNRVQGLQDGQVAFRNSSTGATAVLTGTVTSEKDRKVAQQFLLLEPGISRVENLLELR